MTKIRDKIRGHKTLNQGYAVIATFISPTGKDYREGKMMFVAHDSHSGGYPYWSDTISLNVTKDLDVAIRWLEEAQHETMRDQVDPASIKLVRVETRLIAVTDEDVKEAVRERALSKLTDEERQVLGL